MCPQENYRLSNTKQINTTNTIPYPATTTVYRFEATAWILNFASSQSSKVNAYEKKCHKQRKKRKKGMYEARDELYRKVKSQLSRPELSAVFTGQLEICFLFFIEYLTRIARFLFSFSFYSFNFHALKFALFLFMYSHLDLLPSSICKLYLSLLGLF